MAILKFSNILTVKKTSFMGALLLAFMMFPINNSFAETSSAPVDTTSELNFNYKTYALPGSLNVNPVFNSNSPEVVKTEGILLSTFSPYGKKSAQAHLNRTFQGEFDIFTHHIAVERLEKDLTTLYEGIILYNPTTKTVKLKINASATYNSQPDSPFKPMPDMIDNLDGLNFAGPGDRVDQDILRGKSFVPEREVVIKPREYYLLMNQAIPIKELTPPVNGRTSLFKLESNGALQIADLALYEKKWLFGVKQPELRDWINILNTGTLSEKRDKVPSPLDQPRPKGQPFIYGRVSGVAIGNKWNSKIINDEAGYFNVKESNQGYSYALNTVYANTVGTNQNQSAPIEKRYEDTAYQAHSNYGITYEINIPLFNDSQENRNVTISFDTPTRLGENKPQSGLTFLVNPPEKIAFRGEFKLEYKDEQGNKQEKFIHVVERFRQKGQPLLNLNLKPGELNQVTLTYIYPADATPPHVLTISTR